MKELPRSRRDFLLTAIAKRKEKNASARDQPTETNKIKMLTADGKLVEVNQEAIKNIGEKSKTKNADILKWRNTGKSQI